jgi:hypothetical protein
LSTWDRQQEGAAHLVGEVHRGEEVLVGVECARHLHVCVRGHECARVNVSACVGMCVLHLWGENLADQICTELVTESPPKDEPCIRIHPHPHPRYEAPKACRGGAGGAVREAVVPTASRTGPAESAKIISAFGISDGAGMTEHSSFCIDTIPLQYPFSTPSVSTAAFV